MFRKAYTLSDPSCDEIGCEFSTGGKRQSHLLSLTFLSLSNELSNFDLGNAGPCTNTVGILSYSEIVSLLNNPSSDVQVTLDSTEAVKIAVWDGNQWMGYDDPETLQMKMDYADSHCIGG